MHLSDSQSYKGQDKKSNSHIFNRWNLNFKHHFAMASLSSNLHEYETFLSGEICKVMGMWEFFELVLLKKSTTQTLALTLMRLEHNSFFQIY